MKTLFGRRFRRAVCSGVLAAAALWTVSAAAGASSAADAADTIARDLSLPFSLLRFEAGSFFAETAPSPLARLALYDAPFYAAPYVGDAAAWNSELQQLPSPENDSEDHEDTRINVLPAGETEGAADNGVPARTLRPSAASGYVVSGSVYVNNGSSCEVSEETLSRPYTPPYGSDAPQVLIIHTHGSEAYTMPAGEEYVPSDDHRTTDKSKSVVRVGDEIADVLTARGIGVVHDRELYDYPNYSGAYNRSLSATERYLERYPSILYVLDVHRDAVADADGNPYKLICAEEPRAAQMEFVIGTNGGGASHENWAEHLRLACAIQQTIAADHPTLMRPITVRNSRYNQHAAPGSLLLEVGTSGNSLAEALVSARLFAEGFANTVLPR